MGRFIKLNLGDFIISNGYDKDNREIKEHVKVERFSRKIISVDRIKSLSKKYILIDYLDGRWIYWEYKEDYNTIKNKLLAI